MRDRENDDPALVWTVHESKGKFPDEYSSGIRWRWRTGERVSNRPNDRFFDRRYEAGTQTRR
jgi:hypothetical protein